MRRVRFIGPAVGTEAARWRVLGAPKVGPDPDTDPRPDPGPGPAGRSPAGEDLPPGEVYNADPLLLLPFPLPLPLPPSPNPPKIDVVLFRDAVAASKVCATEPLIDNGVSSSCTAMDPGPLPRVPRPRPDGPFALELDPAAPQAEPVDAFNEIDNGPWAASNTL